MKFNSKDLSALLFFNEVSPLDCYALLVKTWGIGENLAIALINVYGGHLYNISNAVNRLASFSSSSLSLRGNFTVPLDPLATADILTVLEVYGGYADKSSKKLNWNSKVVKALKSLAETGFYAIDKPEVGKEGEPESLEEQFSHLNIAGVVERNSIVPGVPKELWNGKFPLCSMIMLIRFFA